VTESVGKTELLIKIKGATPPGTTSCRLTPGRINDDAGKPQSKTIKFLFTIK
jgi:hypothetical protein